MNRSIVTLTLLFLLIPSAFAAIDLVEPAQNAVLNDVNLTFEYFPTLADINSCTLTVDQQTFPDFTITTGSFNTFTVVSIAEGNHTWKISCASNDSTDISQTRTFTIDRTQPQLTIHSPQEKAIITSPIVNVTATDATSEELSCAVNANASLVASKTVQSGVKSSIPLSIDDGNHILLITCFDEAGNERSTTRNITIVQPPPLLFLNLETNKQQYALGDTVGLTIDSLDGANVTVEVCPNILGFVECLTPLVTDTFPQALILPYANSSGSFIVDAIARKWNQTVLTSVEYEVINTMSVGITASEVPMYDNPFKLKGTIQGAVGTVTYQWVLSNGSTLNTSEVEYRYKTIGEHIEKLIVTDSEGNNATATFLATIDPIFTVTVKVTSEGFPLPNASVQFQHIDSKTTKTETSDNNGQAIFELEDEMYKLFISAEGHKFHLSERSITRAETITVAMDKSEDGNPEVTIVSPVNGATITTPVPVTFTVQDTTTTTCALSYAAAGEQWFTEAGITTVEPEATGSISLPSLAENSYQIIVECQDTTGNIGTSPSFTYAIGAKTETTEIEVANPFLEEDPLSVIDRAYGAYDSFNKQQGTIADLLNWEKMVRDREKIIERSQRDIDAINFRRDLDDEAKEIEKNKLRQELIEARDTTPVDLVIQDSENEVRYLKEDDIAKIAKQLLSDKDYAFDEEQLIEYLTGIQRQFTIETTYTKVLLYLADSSQLPLAVVNHEITYEDAEGHSLYLLLPSGVATAPTQVTLSIEPEILSRSPVTMELPAQESIAYHIQGDIAMSDLVQTQLLLLKEPSAEELSAITGNAIFDTGSMTISALILALFLIIGGLAYKFHLIKHLRYLFYAESRKKPLHSLKTIISDGMALIEAGNLENAMMRFKEAKLAYEQLNQYSQNEVYEDLMEFHSTLDTAYFNLLVNRIHQSIEQNNLEAAIDDFERLEGTFHTLPPNDQDQLIAVVHRLAEKLGTGGGV